MASTSAPQPANNMARSPSAHPMSATGRPAMSAATTSKSREMSSATVGTHESVSKGYQSPSESCVFFFSSLSFTQRSWAERRNAAGLSGIRKGIQAVTPLLYAFGLFGPNGRHWIDPDRAQRRKEAAHQCHQQAQSSRAQECRQITRLDAREKRLHQPRGYIRQRQSRSEEHM